MRQKTTFSLVCYKKQNFVSIRVIKNICIE